MLFILVCCLCLVILKIHHRSMSSCLSPITQAAPASQSCNDIKMDGCQITLFANLLITVNN